MQFYQLFFSNASHKAQLICSIFFVKAIIEDVTMQQLMLLFQLPTLLDLVSTGTKMKKLQ